MDEMLNRAEQVAEDRNDEKYNERYCMLREIVDWSLKRHSTWKWSLICGALLGAGIFYYFKSDQEDSILRAKAEREQVEQWKTVKVAPTAYDKCPDQHANDAWTLRLSTAEKYKMYTLIEEQPIWRKRWTILKRIIKMQNAMIVEPDIPVTITIPKNIELTIKKE